MTTSSSETLALLVRERALRDLGDRISSLADSMTQPDGIEWWSGAAAEAFRCRIDEHRVAIARVRADVDQAESMVRGWRVA